LIYLFFFLVTNNPCNNVTEDCMTNPTTGIAVCTCQSGYVLNTTVGSCTGMNKYSKLKFQIFLFDFYRG